MTARLPDSQALRRLMLALALAIAPTVPAATASAQTGTPGDATLANGTPVVDVAIDPKVDAARVRATIDIPAAPDTVWAVMTDCARMLHFVPGLESCRILERDPQGRWDVREHRINWAWFLPNIRTVFRADYDRPRTIKFRRVGGDLKVSTGEWRLVPQNGGRATRLDYDAIVGAEVPVPDFIVVEAIRKDMATVLRQLREECTGAQ